MGGSLYPLLDEGEGKMEYKVILVAAPGHMGTDFEKGSERLAELVNEAFQQGWKPQGGIAVGEAQVTRERFILQAVVKG